MKKARKVTVSPLGIVFRAVAAAILIVVAAAFAISAVTASPYQRRIPTPATLITRPPISTPPASFGTWTPPAPTATWALTPRVRIPDLYSPLLTANAPTPVPNDAAPLEPQPTVVAEVVAAVGYPPPPQNEAYPPPSLPTVAATELICDFDTNPCVCAPMPNGEWACWRVSSP